MHTAKLSELSRRKVSWFNGFCHNVGKSFAVHHDQKSVRLFSCITFVIYGAAIHAHAMPLCSHIVPVGHCCPLITYAAA